MIYGYLRVSSDEQDVNSQKQGVVRFAEAREWKIDEYITDEQRDELRKKIQIDLTIPQIAETMKEYTYEQVYDTILCDAEFNPLYRGHGQRKVRKCKY